MGLMYDEPLPELEGFDTRKPYTFWEHFEDAFDTRAVRTFSDRLHPLKVMRWNFNRDDDDSWHDEVDRANRQVKSALVKSVRYSLRDASAILPVAVWLEGREDALSELFLSSVDAVEEEAVAPLKPEYRPAERRWWQELAEKRILRYGIRPFRTNPYSFFSVRVQEADRLLLLGHVRYYFRDLADHRFEMAVSVPLGNGFALDAGNAYQFGRHEDENKLVVKLSKSLNQGGIVHLGVELQSSPAVFAGLSVPL